MAQIPEVLEGETRPHVTIRIDARERSGPDAIGDPDDVAVVGRQVGERPRAVDEVAQHDDPVGMRALEHRPVRQRDVGTVVDVAEEEPEFAGTSHLVHALQHLDVERVRHVPRDDTDQGASAAAQPARQEVRFVAEVGRRGQHAVARLVADRDA